MIRFAKFGFCVLFLVGLAVACYRRPVPDDFDRYIYEAIVRGKSEPIDVTYSMVKHESPRAESSSVLDSPQHLRELEPLYTIRPLYIALISFLGSFLPIQNAINLISATALFGIGLLVLLWTQRPLLTALLMAAQPVLLLGRFGTPDALAALLVLAALCMLNNQTYVSLALLFLSLGVRTDNLVLLVLLLTWLAWNKQLSVVVAGGLAFLAFGTVAALNHWAGNYGWIVLFRYSFVSGRYPAQIPNTLTLGEYLHAFVSGATIIFSKVAIWLLVGILAWRRRQDPLLMITACAAAAHFVLFPSPEDRYLVWAYIVAGVLLIRSYDEAQRSARYELKR